jgi:CubicO group peptidase (beta-lactamase class C family)
MKILVRLALCGAALLASGDIRGEGLDSFPAFIERAMREWNVPGAAVAVVKDGEILFNRGFGFRDVDRKLPVTTRTQFAIASCTKAFTTTLLGMLADEGRVDWDEPVRSYYPEFTVNDPMLSDLITLRDLAVHRTGLARHDHVWLGTPFERSDLVRRIEHLSFSHGFREAYRYNNLMYVALGKLIEELTGTTWEEAVRRRILLPLGMTATSFSVAEMQQSEDFAHAYTVGGGWKEAPFRTVDALGPAGSINSNSTDMARWLRFLLNDGIVQYDTLITRDRLRETMAPFILVSGNGDDDEYMNSSYGMGWRVSEYREHRIVYHGGAIGAYRAYVILLPDDNIGVVSLINANRSQFNTVVAYNAIDRLISLDLVPWSRRFGRNVQSSSSNEGCATHPRLTRPLDAYTGVFEHPAYGEIEFIRRGNRIAISRYGVLSDLEICGVDIFRRQSGAWGVFRSRTQFIFSAGDDGVIESVAIPLDESVDEIVFMRRGD